MSGPHLRIGKRFNAENPMVAGSPDLLFTTIRRPTYFALQLAAIKMGSEAALGRHLGVSQQIVDKWVRGEEPLPIRHWERVVQCAEVGESL